MSKRGKFLFVAFILVAFALFTIIKKLYSIDDRLVFSIDSFILNKTKNITIGNEGDIFFKKLPKDYIEVDYNKTERYFSYKIKQDTCVYYWVNNENPNLHSLNENSVLKVNFNDRVIDLKTNDIISCVGKAKSKYIRLSNILEKKEGIKEFPSDLKSIIYQKEQGEEYKVVILDQYTTLNDTIKYKFVGNTRNLENKDNIDKFKIQIFDVITYSYKKDKIDEEIFSIGSKNYVTKLTEVLTDWHAGNFMLFASNDANSMHVKYPKSIIYAESLDTLLVRVKQTANTVTIKQKLNLFPASNELFIPAISSSITSEIFSLEFSKDSITLIDNYNNRSRVKDGLYCIPKFDKFEIKTKNNDVLNCRIGVINNSFLSSFLILPLIIFVVLVVSSVITYHRKYNNEYIFYLFVILLIALSYMISKLLIGIKLSYTFPYFEKITGVEIVAVCASLVLFYSILTLINWKNIIVPKIIPIITIIIGLVISFIALYFSDKFINFDVAQSYLPSEWWTMKFWTWKGAAGMNDTHRTIVYMLFSTNILILFVSLIYNFCPKVLENFKGKLINIYTKGCSNYQKLKQKIMTISYPQIVRKILELVFFVIKLVIYIIPFITFFINSIINSIHNIFVPKDYKVKVSISTYISAFKYALSVTIFPVILLFSLFLMGGGSNYLTAIISFIVIYSLSHAYISVPMRGAEESHFAWTQRLLWSMFYCSVIIIIFALMPDKGYVTNYVGFVLAFLCFYSLIFKNRNSLSLENDEINDENKIKRWFLCFPIILFTILYIIFSIFGSRMLDPENIIYDRTERRIMLYTQFDEIREAGYRYTETDSEFMLILNHYMHEESSGDPLAVETHYLHPAISTGQSPVVLNDVSFPAAFVGAYGKCSTTLVFVLLLLSLGIAVFAFGCLITEDDKGTFDVLRQWRILAYLMWLGTSVYIYLSYYGIVPFTGRLIPGYGVDAVGEAIESVMLLAAMASMSSK